METAEEDLHPIFVHDPEEWMQYVYKKVKVVTQREEELEGWVYTVDPVSQNLVLVQFTDHGATQMQIIMRDSIRQTSVLEDSSPPGVKDKLDQLFRPPANQTLSAPELAARKRKLKMWLEKNRLPVQTSEGEMLSISDALTIRPPYGVDDCHSTNEIILGRIRGLVQNMPADHDQW